MLKIIGSIIVICTTTIMGFIYAGMYGERVKQLRQIQYALNMLEAEIVYTSTPLLEAFRNIGEKSSGVIKKMFLLMADYLELKNTDGVLNAFKEAEKGLHGELLLNKEELDVIYSFMNSLGSSDIEGQKKNFNITIKKLEAFETKAEEFRVKNEKLYKYLGVSAGMIIVIMLI